MPARLDFKAIAEGVDIYVVAKQLGLQVVKGRAHCPVCDTDRAIELKPETNTFICYAGHPRQGCNHLSGDCIALWAHVKGYEGQYRAAKELSELFGVATATRREQVPGTPPQKPEASSRPSASPAPPPSQKGFDADKFGAELSYTEEVASLGLSQAAAELYRIGTKRGKLYIPVCPPGVTPAGYAEFKEGKLRVPDKWLAPSNVVTFPKTA